MIEKGYYHETPQQTKAHNGYKQIAIDSAKPNAAVLAGPQSIQDGDSFTPDGTKIKHTPAVDQAWCN